MTTLSKSLILIGGLAASLPAAASTGATVPFSGDLPPIHTAFETWDVCQKVDDLIERLGLVSAYLPRLCDHEMTQTFAIGPAAVSISGTLDSLVVRDGMVDVTGEITGSVELSPPHIEGGRAPVFAPCDRGDFVGCFQPDPAVLGELFASPELALLPLDRMCIPGLPVVVKPARRIAAKVTPGRWVGGTWQPPTTKPPRWIPPVLETCRVTDWGELPTITRPHVERATVDAYPRVRADMGLSITGDGAIEVEIPIPYTGVTAGYGNQWVDLKVAAGAFLVMTLEVEDAGADAHLRFDQDVHVRLTYERGVGWSQHATVLRDASTPSIVPHGPNVTLRAALKLAVEANAKAGLGDDDAAADDDASDDAAGEDTTDDTAEGGDAGLPPLPVSEDVECAAEWVVGGAALELGLEANAALELFVEGTYPLFSADGDATFDVDAGLELSHAEAISIPGMCEIGCEAVAGDDNPACAPVEVFRVPVAAL